jgi:class 3 adenylate cyclase/transcriptional regulator with GAF, ATPase, and Fis domain
MPSKEDTEGQERSPQAAGSIQETFRRSYHLRTLYDVSKELFGSIEFETVLKNFLFMTMGNFGVSDGFILTRHDPSKEITHFVSMGFQNQDHDSLKSDGLKFLQETSPTTAVEDSEVHLHPRGLPATVACTVPFRVDAGFSGLLGLGLKLTDETFTDDDKEVLLTLINNLVVALKNARAFQNIKCLNENLQKKNVRIEEILSELDQRVFHLKTLYDFSKDIFATVDFEAVLRNFLLMTLGNFGVIEGFILTLDRLTEEITHFVPMGCNKADLRSLQERAKEYLLRTQIEKSIEENVLLTGIPDLPRDIPCTLLFHVDETCHGLLGLGSKLTGTPYNDNDKELLLTLLNNLIIALRNVRSFEEIKCLNKDLRAKNVQLEKTLDELQNAIRKVGLLESIKANLSKFVPTTVSRLIEKSPKAGMPEAKEQDVSILFLDIEGYTKLSERLDSAELNKLIERYFSVFMDAIHANNGDVYETAGDGLMVLFLNEDAKINALEAVHTALTIQEKAALINREENACSESLVVNMGINSGLALVGAAKFNSHTGSRWTYTARGMVTNVAARIGALASNGAIHLSRSTADRVKDHFSVKPKGKFRLKNVSEDVEIFTVNE